MALGNTRQHFIEFLGCKSSGQTPTTNVNETSANATRTVCCETKKIKTEIVYAPSAREGACWHKTCFAPRQPPKQNWPLISSLPWFILRFLEPIPVWFWTQSNTAVVGRRVPSLWARFHRLENGEVPFLTRLFQNSTLKTSRPGPRVGGDSPKCSSGQVQLWLVFSLSLRGLPNHFFQEIAFPSPVLQPGSWGRWIGWITITAGSELRNGLLVLIWPTMTYKHLPAT